MLDIILDSRLQAVFNEILPCNCLVDVGTDHGKIPVKSILNSKCKKAIAADISALSLKKAMQLADKFSINNLIDCRLGDGLQQIDEKEYDTLVIAGMGGLEIISILSKAKKTFNRYILLPHRNAPQLRQYLSQINVAPYKDYMVECNGKFYNLLVGSNGEYLPNELEINYGKERNTPIFSDYLNKEVKKMLLTLKGNLSHDVRKLKEKKLFELKEMYEDITNCRNN